MRITMETDYAIRILFYLCKKNTRCDSTDMVQQLGIPPRYCLKILRRLSAAGMIRSYPGKGGGYEPYKAPCDITLKDIVALFEGPIQLSRCQDEAFDCTRVSDRECCVFHRIFAVLGEQIAQKLDRITLAAVTDHTRSINEILSLIQP